MPTLVTDADTVWTDTDDKPKPRIPNSPPEILKRQERMANDVKPADTDNVVLDYFGGGSGTPLKYGKSGFIANGEKIDESRRFTPLYEETQVGFIKFDGPGMPPEKRTGPLFKGFKVPRREELGDLDETLWPVGLSGRRSDPWQQQVTIPLQDDATGELFVFATTSVTGRRAVGNLISQCQRLARTDPGSHPMIVLKDGGFKHARYGFVKTPSFIIVGRVAKDGSTTSPMTAGDEMNDSIPL